MPELAKAAAKLSSQTFFRRLLAAAACLSLVLNIAACWQTYHRRPLREAASRSLMAERSSFFYDSGFAEPVPVAALKLAMAAGAEPDAAVRAGGIAVYVLLFIVTLVVFWNRYNWACAPLSALFVACNMFFGYYAMEGSAHLYSLLFLVLFWHFFQGAGRASGLLAGLFAALACLSRLDSALVVLAVAGLTWAVRRGGFDLKRAGLALGLALALTAPYLAWQKAAYGNALYAQELGLRRFANTALLRADPRAQVLPGPVGPFSFLLRDGAAGAVSGTFAGLGRAIAYEVPRAVHYKFMFVLIFLGVYAAFTLKKDPLLFFAAGALLPALPLAAVPAGGLEIKYYLCLLWALCALAGLGLSETVAWIEKVAPRAAAGGNKEGRNK